MRSGYSRAKEFGIAAAEVVPRSMLRAVRVFASLRRLFWAIALLFKRSV
jgi:hypothetical protein